VVKHLLYFVIFVNKINNISFLLKYITTDIGNGLSLDMLTNVIFPLKDTSMKSALMRIRSFIRNFIKNYINTKEGKFTKYIISHHKQFHPFYPIPSHKLDDEENEYEGENEEKDNSLNSVGGGDAVFENGKKDIYIS